MAVFKPTERFFDWFIPFIRKRPVVEAGCGDGELLAELTKRGVKTFGIDILKRDDRVYGMDTNICIMEKDATTFDYPEGSVVIVARPTRGWAARAMQRALDCGCEVVYIGKTCADEGCLDNRRFCYREDYAPFYARGIETNTINWRDMGDEQERAMVIRKQTLMDQIRHDHYTSTVRERIPVDLGVGIEFDAKASYAGPDGHEEVMTTFRTEMPKPVDGKRPVLGRIYSYIGSIGAVHYYAKLDVGSSPCEIIAPDWLVDQSHVGRGGGVEPEEARGFSLEVNYPAKEDIYSTTMAYGTELVASKGELTHQFPTEADAMEAMFAEFERIFGREDWYLTRNEFDANDNRLEWKLPPLEDIKIADVEDTVRGRPRKGKKGEDDVPRVDEDSSDLEPVESADDRKEFNYEDYLAEERKLEEKLKAKEDARKVKRLSTLENSRYTCKRCSATNIAWADIEEGEYGFIHTACGGDAKRERLQMPSRWPSGLVNHEDLVRLVVGRLTDRQKAKKFVPKKLKPPVLYDRLGQFPYFCRMCNHKYLHRSDAESCADKCWDGFKKSVIDALDDPNEIGSWQWNLSDGRWCGVAGYDDGSIKYFVSVRIGHVEFITDDDLLALENDIVEMHQDSHTVELPDRLKHLADIPKRVVEPVKGRFHGNMLPGAYNGKTEE